MPEMLRPGGMTITGSALREIILIPNSRILDIGCGSGATVAYLRGLGYNALGIDTTLPPDAPPELICADAAALPFERGRFDAVFFECSLSKIVAPEAALFEAQRVLKPGGALVVSDLFTHGEAAELSGLLGRIEPWNDIFIRLNAADFALQYFEEFKDALATFWGQLVFDYGLAEATALISGNADATTQMRGCVDMLKSKDNSYFLAVLKAV